ncbi:MAG TPA: imidazole glycerol phosphate synthase subunit HisF [Aurantimonas coralicida]|uniref:Imidazole glycerol phosphate synthase subunit HisF n=2 Tax=root TaxID=1 RepID=A0A9C9NDL8_9HYPH|nr:imidazole glycerol phosphate synthase subunit HisF [Aurantimonas coralicida]HET99660.1 imidazole glycerol phosphate synthase subunit HisF [Aurantimonas coralicida]
MPLAFRLIARLDIKAPNLIKTVRLEGVRVVGDPQEYAKRYDQEGIDEILYIDVVASLYQRNSLASLVEWTSEHAFVPVTVGGGVRSTIDARALLRAGADKLALNTAAVERPGLITEIAEKFGSSTIAVQIDAKRKASSWEAYSDGGRQPTGKDVVVWAQDAVEQGAGEVLLTSIDHEGTGQGFDLELIRAVAGAVPVPVVASGGFGESSHAVSAALAGASGVAIAGALHYRRVPLSAMREALSAADVPVRRAA